MDRTKSKDVRIIKFVANTDWKMLKKQKEGLAILIDMRVREPELEGLLNFIDAFQDMLISEFGFDADYIGGNGGLKSEVG